MLHIIAIEYNRSDNASIRDVQAECLRVREEREEEGEKRCEYS